MRITATHDGVNFMGLRPKTGDYHLIAEVSKLNNLSGIGAYSNIKNFLALMINESELVLVKASEGQREILANAPVSESESLFLKYEVENGRYYRFFWSENGNDWIPVKVRDDYQVDASWLPQWGYAPRVGFITDGEEGSVAHYSSLKMVEDR